MDKKPETEVAIIGAGSTGLLLAQGLKEAGIGFRIFERHDKHHISREWSMSLHWGGEFLTTVLPANLRDRLDEINADPDHDWSSEKGFVQCNGETGEVILIMPGTMPRRISRRKLRTLLSEGLNIEYNRSLTDLALHDPESGSPSITATFSDGSTLDCRALVGCDGSRSKVRDQIFGSDERSALAPTPYTILNFPISYPSHIASQLRAIHPVFKVAYHPKNNSMYMLSVLDSASASGEVAFQNLLSWRGAPSAADIKADPSIGLERFKELGEQFAPPFNIAAANVSSPKEIFADQGMQWDPRPHFTVCNGSSSWNNHSWAGTVTLAGDAAHPMLPYRGQGLNHALEDAARLTTALRSVFKDSTKSLQEAIAEYEEEMVKRGGQEVETTARAGKAAHDWSILMQSPM